jgi:hypothetical protein
MAAKKGKKQVGAGSATPRKASVDRDAEEIKRYKMKLPVPVGKDVREKASHEMARVHHAQEALKTERRNTNANLRERQNSLSQQMGELADTVDNSTELQDVNVVERLLRTGEIEVIRLDTKEVVDTRTATAAERQKNLPGVESGEEEEEDLPGPRSKAKK